MQSIQFSDATSNAPVDLALLFEAVGGLEEEARALITIYREQASDLFERLAKAVAESNGPDIEHLAHKLAGSSASCGMTLL